MKYKSIVLDLDGTLLNSQQKVSPENEQALRDCISNNLDIWVATARPYRLVFEEKGVLNGLDFLEKKGVFYNGAYASNKVSGYIKHYPIPSNLVSDILGLIEEVEQDTQVVVQNQEDYHGFRFPNTEIMDWWGFPEEDCIGYPNARRLPCSKIVVWDESKDLSKLYEMLQERFSESLNIFITSSFHWVQIMNKNATKENALLDLLSYHGIAPDEVVVFGDDLPDLGMICTFDCSIAMANARTELKDAAKFTTSSNDQHGVNYALRELLNLI